MEKQKSPELRFKGFNDSWVKKELSQLGNVFTGGGTPSTTEYTYWNGDLPWFQSSDLSDENVLNISPKKFITQIALKNSAAKQVRENSIAIVTRVGVGKVALIPCKYATSQDFLSISSLEVDSVFGVYLISELMKDESKNVQGTSIKGITNDVLLKKELYISLFDKEQKKIGNFFQNLDQSITLHEKKLAQTQNLKKAMLEKMFPKVGSLQPEIRLKGFCGDWEDSQLFNSISIKHGFAFDGEYFSDVETDLCLLTPGNFMIGGGFKADKFIYYKGDVPANYILQENDLIVTMTDLSKESDTLGLPALLPSIHGKTLLHNQRLGLISFDNDELDKKFLFYLFQTESYHKYIVLTATGTTVKHTSPNKILGFIYAKPDIKEQAKIGQFFKQLDETLVLQQQQLQTLKNLKQAFLEKMFV